MLVTLLLLLISRSLIKTNVRRQLENANNQAYQSVAVAPVPGRRPLAPTLQAQQSTNYTPFIGEAAMIIGGFTGVFGKAQTFFGQGSYKDSQFLPGIGNARSIWN